MFNLLSLVTFQKRHISFPASKERGYGYSFDHSYPCFKGRVSNSVPLALLFISMFVMGVTTFIPSAQAQASRDVNNRLNRLENEINTISRAVFKSNKKGVSGISQGATGVPYSGDAAEAEVRIQQLETQLRELTGAIEQQSYQIRQLQEKFDTFAADTEVRFQDLASRPAQAPVAGFSPNTRSGAPNNSYGGVNSRTGSFPQAGVQAGVNAQASAGQNVYSARNLPANPGNTNSAYGNPNQIQPSSGTLGALSMPPGVSDSASYYGSSQQGSRVDQAASSYENAFALLKSNNYEAAEQAFGTFLNQYPSHALAPNAQYWHGETFYVRGKYERAARIFASAYQKNPNGSKAPDNLLKLGMSLAGMGNSEDACVALKQLQGNKASNSTPVLRRAKQEIDRLGCA